MGNGGRCPETRAGRYARCEAPKPSWGSSDCGGTLESRVLRKAHARFGEGRMEKCSRSNSPAAYSTSTTAATRGTSSPIGPGSSCPSDCATGLTGSDHRDLVLCVLAGMTMRSQDRSDPASAIAGRSKTRWDCTKKLSRRKRQDRGSRFVEARSMVEPVQPQGPPPLRRPLLAATPRPGRCRGGLGGFLSSVESSSLPSLLKSVVAES